MFSHFEFDNKFFNFVIFQEHSQKYSQGHVLMQCYNTSHLHSWNLNPTSFLLRYKIKIISYLSFFK